MKIELEIDEAKILELAKADSIDNLPNAIFYEAKRQGIEEAVKEIKNKLVEKSYYNGKETLFREVSEHLWKSIDENIKDLVVKKFSEKEIEYIVSRHFDRTFTEWIEKKIYSRLEELKKDVFIGSYGEIIQEQEAVENAHREEIESMQDN